MKRKFIVYLIVSMFLLMGSTTIGISEGSDMGQAGTPSHEKQWTLMLYDDADFYMAFDPLDWFATEAFSSDQINVLVLQDKEHDPASMWYVDENHDKILLEEMGEINMGNYTVLRDFVAYCKNNYSAERYMLFFYDHGGGWMGACWDNTDDDWLAMDEIQRALTETGVVDVVCYSAPCLMGAVESAYELRNCTEIYIGSEEGSGYMYWGDVIGDICTLINDDTNIPNTDLGEEIINMIKKNLFEKFSNRMYRKGRRMVTMSAIDTSKMEKVAISIDQLAQDLTDKINTSRSRIKLVHSLTQPFAKYGIRAKSNILDVYDLAKKCYLFFFFDDAIRSNSNEVMESINGAVIANLRGIRHLQAHGLTIYFPADIAFYDGNYTNSNLDFTNNTYWDEFLEAYLG